MKIKRKTFDTKEEMGKWVRKAIMSSVRYGAMYIAPTDSLTVVYTVVEEEK